MGDEIRQRAEVALAEKFPHLQVSVGGARLIEGQGIAIYDLQFDEAASSQSHSHLLSVDELLLECDASLTQLVQGIPEVRRVVVRRPRCSVRRDPSGRLNIESLLPLPKSQIKRPPILIENASITYSDLAKSKLPPLHVRDLNLAIAGSGDSELVSVNGTLSGSQLRKARLRASFDPTSGTYRGELGIDSFSFDDDLQEWLNTHLAHSPHGQSLSGLKLGYQMTGYVQVFGNLHAEPQAAASLQIVAGRAEHPRLPRPLTNLRCQVELLNKQLEVKDFHAQCGPAAVAGAARRNGLSPAAPTTLAARVVQLPLDKALRKSLPGLLQEQWEKFQPEGIVDVTLQASFDGQRWSPNATLKGTELSFTSDKFPYRLHEGFGTIIVTPRKGVNPLRLDINLTGHGGGQPIHIKGQVFDPKPEARGWATISGKQVEIEKKMLAALPAKPREVIESLHPSGKIDFNWRIDRYQDGAKPRTTLDMSLVDLAVNYDRFPYPLRGISGTIHAEDDRWTFRDMVSGGRRQIRCQGFLQPAPVGSVLSLRFTGEKVPLDDNLFEAFDEHVQQAWTELRPRGHVDFTADVDYRTGQGKPRIRADVRPRPETALLRPKFFDYLLENVSGLITYDEGAITLEQVRGRHVATQTQILTNGNGFFAPSGAWQMQLFGLTVDRIAVGRDLLTALPPKLSKLIDSLKPTGSFRIDNGVLAFQKAASPIAPVIAEWDFQLNCQQTNLQCGIDLHNLHGSVRLVGAADGQRNYSAGELDLDTVMFEGVQFTSVKGPMWADDNQCLLGRKASAQSGKPPQPITATAYDGRIAADARVTYYGTPRYEASANLVGIDLSRLVVERFGSTEDMSGKIDANVSIGGEGHSLYSLSGKGDIHLREADIYESPVLLRLLKTLRNGKLSKSAFSEGDIRFRLDGQHIYLDQLDFLGDVVNLKGKGYTNFDHELKLVFHAEVGPTDYQIPVVKNLMRRTNQQILQLYVDGTFSDPIVQKQPFPGISQLLNQIQSDFEAAPANRPPLAPRTATGQVRRN